MDYFNEMSTPFIVGFIKSFQSRLLFWMFTAFCGTLIFYYIDYIEFNGLWDIIGVTIGMGAILILATNLAVHLVNIVMANKVSFAKKQHLQMISWTFILIFLCRTMTLSSSSFIEEEHLVWYYLTVTLYLYLIVQNVYVAISQRLPNTNNSHIHLQIRLDNSINTSSLSLYSKNRKLLEFKLCKENLKQICTIFLALLIIIIAQSWNGAGVRWYDRRTMHQFFQYANRIYLQLIFLFGKFYYILLTDYII